MFDADVTSQRLHGHHHDVALIALEVLALVRVPLDVAVQVLAAGGLKIAHVAAVLLHFGVQTHVCAQC